MQYVTEFLRQLTLQQGILSELQIDLATFKANAETQAQAINDSSIFKAVNAAVLSFDAYININNNKLESMLVRSIL